MDTLISMLMIFGLISFVLLVVGVWVQWDMTRKRMAEKETDSSSPNKPGSP